MTQGQRLLARWLSRNEPEPPPVAALLPTGNALQLLLDDRGRVVQIHGALNHGLTPVKEGAEPKLLLDYLMPGSTQALEGTPAQWTGQMIDLDFRGADQQVLRTRGWVQPQAEGWLLQLIDISDLQRDSQQARVNAHNSDLIHRIGQQLRQCDLARLPAVMLEALQQVAEHWRVPGVALALRTDTHLGWRLYSAYHAFDTPQLWTTGQTLGTALDGLKVCAPIPVSANKEPADNQWLISLFGNAEGLLVPFRDQSGASAWLL